MLFRVLTVGLILAVGALCILSFSAGTEAHHAVLRFNLEEMTMTANRIFLGKCVAVDETTESLAGGVMPVTHYSFQVERAIKGKLPALITFTQLGHSPKPAKGKSGEITMHGQAVSPATFIHGMSEYKVGDRMLLFLIPDYLGGKVTYPVGLDQGAFHVTTLDSGEALVRNGLNNLGLFTAPYNGTALKREDATTVFPEMEAPISAPLGPSLNPEAMAHKRGALPLGGFIELVNHIHQSHGGQPGSVAAVGRGLVR